MYQVLARLSRPTVQKYSNLSFESVWVQSRVSTRPQSFITTPRKFYHSAGSSRANPNKGQSFQKTQSKPDQSQAKPATTNPDNLPPQPPKSRSGIKYHTPEARPQTPAPIVIHSSPAAAREAVKPHGFQQDQKKKAAGDAQSIIEILNKVRQHKIYQLTRLFLIGSVLVMMSKRITEAKMLPDEIFEEDDDFGDKIQKTLKKTMRIVISTVTRSWSPFQSIDIQDVDDIEADEDGDENQPGGSVVSKPNVKPFSSAHGVMVLDETGNINSEHGKKVVNVWDSPLPKVDNVIQAEGAKSAV